MCLKLFSSIACFVSKQARFEFQLSYGDSVTYIAKLSSRCLHYFLAAMLVYHCGTPTWRFFKCMQIFRPPSIWSSGKRVDLKLGEVSSLFTSYNITIYWFYPLNEFFQLLRGIAVARESDMSTLLICQNRNWGDSIF